MTLKEQELNVGLLIKALHEKSVKGINTYAIHDLWVEITDMSLMDKIVFNGYLLKEGNVISFTDKGRAIIDDFYSEAKEIPNEKLYSTLMSDSEKIIHLFTKQS